MGATTRDIWEYLSVEEDDAFVLSGIFETDGDSCTLMACSLLAGPEAIARSGWPRWRLDEGFKPIPSADAVEIPIAFSVELDGAIAGRAVLGQREAFSWLRSVLEVGLVPRCGELPEAQASLRPADAPIRVCTHSESKAGDLATWLARPIVGFHFLRSDTPSGVAAPRGWDIGGARIFNPAVNLLGISWFEEKAGDPPSGLLLGRFERRAWLVSQQLLTEDDLYRVHIGIDPDRVDLADLELEIEERVGDELVFAEHLRLEDTDVREAIRTISGLPAATGRPDLQVRLPTLGRGVKRAVKLFHRDGALLDEWESFNIVESISISLKANGETLAPIKIGERRTRQGLVELLGAVERVRSQYETLRREGTHNRIFDDPGEGRKALRAVLERAKGELLVVDPYYRDWDLLENLPGPAPRVLIGSAVDPPPQGSPARVARWRGDLAPFHDRFFLWEGGGVSVGTSAGAVRDRLFRIVRLNAAESEELRARFALWWADPGFERV